MFGKVPESEACELIKESSKQSLRGYLNMFAGLAQFATGCAVLIRNPKLERQFIEHGSYRSMALGALAFGLLWGGTNRMIRGSGQGQESDDLYEMLPEGIGLADAPEQEMIFDDELEPEVPDSVNLAVELLKVSA